MTVPFIFRAHDKTKVKNEETVMNSAFKIARDNRKRQLTTRKPSFVNTYDKDKGSNELCQEFSNDLSLQ